MMHDFDAFLMRRNRFRKLAPKLEGTVGCKEVSIWLLMHTLRTTLYLIVGHQILKDESHLSVSVKKARALIPATIFSATAVIGADDRALCHF